MSDALAEFLEAYDEHRVKDQSGFYAKRTEEYVASARQIAAVSEIFLFLAALCGTFGAFLSGYNLWLGLLAAGLSAGAAAVASWGDIIGFSANAELYGAASAGLARLRPRRPDASSPSVEEIGDYLVAVEDILMGEVRTWGEKWGRENSSEPLNRTR